MLTTSTWSTTQISTEDKKSAAPGLPVCSDSSVASAKGDATRMSASKKSAYSFTAPLQPA